jgi:hypothetical protein
MKLYAHFKNGAFSYYTPSGNRVNGSYVNKLRNQYRTQQVTSYNVPKNVSSKLPPNSYFYEMTINLPANFKPPSECELQAVKIQEGGTCWFHSILNGWLLSGAGRVILKKILLAYKNTAEYKRYADINACPRRGTLPLNFFWHYVDHMLKPPSNRNLLSFKNARLIQNLNLRNIENNPPLLKFNWDGILYRMGADAFKNELASGNINSFTSLLNSTVTAKQLINSGIMPEEVNKIIRFRNDPLYRKHILNMQNNGVSLNRYINKITRGGYSDDKKAFNNKIFPGMWSTIPEYNKPIVELFTGRVKILQRRGDYELSHAFLVIRNAKSAHAICGYICSDDKEYIYDSAYGLNIPLKWTDTENIKKYADKRWPSFEYDAQSSGITYIRRDLITNKKLPNKLVPPPPPPPRTVPPPPPPRVNAPLKFKYPMSTRNFKVQGFLETLKLNKGYLKCRDIPRDVLNKIANEHKINKNMFKTPGLLCAEFKRMHNKL